MTEDNGGGQFNSLAQPTYVVNVAKQQSTYHLTVRLPGSDLGYVVSTIDDMALVDREIRSLVASRLGVGDGSFALTFLTSSTS